MKKKYTLYKVYNKLFSYFKGDEEYKTIWIIGQGGIGKSFLAFTRMIYRSIKFKEPFCLILESTPLVQNLSKNNGEVFLTRLINGWKEGSTNKFKWLYKKTHDKEGACLLKIEAGIFTLNGATIGYLVSYNKFASLKASNVIIKRMIVDEFIPEKLTFMNRDIDTKLTSLFESLGRDDITEIIFMANPIRLNNPLMSSFGFDVIKKGETLKKISVIDDRRVYAVCHYIDDKKFKKFTKEKEKTASGEFAIITGNTYRLYGEQSNMNEHVEIVRKPDKIRPFIFCNLGTAFMTFYNDIKNKRVVGHIIPAQSRGRVFCDLTTPIHALQSPSCRYNKTLYEILLNIYNARETCYTSDSACLVLKDFVLNKRR